MKRKKKAAASAESTVNLNNEGKQKSFRRLIIIVVAIVLGVAIIATGIILPFVFNDEYTTDKDVNPVAQISLSNGMTLEYEILESQAPAASTNFIYLASIGYFDGTIIHDNSNGWVRFGGYQTDSVHRGDSNKEFLSTVTDRDAYKNNKFGYRLGNTKDSACQLDMVGALAFSYARSATEFQIMGLSRNQRTDLVEGDDNANGWLYQVFATPTTETVECVRKLVALQADTEHAKFTHSYFCAPLDNGNLITIKSVKVIKKYKDKWENFNFVDFFVNDSETKCGSWIKTSQKKTGKE